MDTHSTCRAVVTAADWARRALTALPGAVDRCRDIRSLRTHLEPIFGSAGNAICILRAVGTDSAPGVGATLNSLENVYWHRDAILATPIYRTYAEHLRQILKNLENANQSFDSVVVPCSQIVRQWANGSR